MDRLFVLWTDPEDRRHLVGELWRSEGIFHFGYWTDRLDQARKDGFQLLMEFPEPRDLEHPYKARSLFRTFQQRIPSQSRRDYKAILESWNIDHPDDPFEILARSGGVQLTDRIELAEYRPADDDLSHPLFFRLAGAAHYRPAAGDLEQGKKLTLKREAQNEFDRFATVVLMADDDRQVGWVPRQYAELVGSHLDRGSELDARVARQLILPEDRGRWIVRLIRADGALKAK